MGFRWLLDLVFAGHLACLIECSQSTRGSAHAGLGAITHRVLIAFPIEGVARRVWFLCRLLADDRRCSPNEQSDQDCIGKGLHGRVISD